MLDGWIKLHRKLTEWGWWSSLKHSRLFIEILIRANYRETKWRKEILAPGQLLTGRKQLSQWTGLTESQIRTALRDLISTNEISIKKTNQYSIITIINWCSYQQDDQQTDKRVANELPTDHQRIATSKKEKKEKKERSNMLDFESIYLRYPLKRGKKKGIEKCKKLIKSQTQYSNLEKAVDNYAQRCIDENVDPQYMLQFSSFMSVWEDWIDYEVVEKNCPFERLASEIISESDGNKSGLWEVFN